jgi:hypothetical protein
MTNVSDSFGHTMRGLEAGLRVQHVATFDLRTCSINDSAAAVLADESFADFDQIPVRDNAGRIVGILNRTAQPALENASAAMQQLDESLLVSSEAPLMSFIRLAGTAPYKLVLNEHGIKGIVTRSDLLKLPVRLLAFAFVTHLETLMADAIRTKYLPGDESWLILLSDGRQQKVAEKRDKLHGSRMEPDLLELAEFCDKRQIVRKISGFARDFIDDTQDLQELRDKIAHAATFISNDAEACEFALKLQKAEKWIAKLQELIHHKAQA